MTGRQVTIATRKSPLALWQAYYVRDRLQEQHPDLQVDLLTRWRQSDRQDEGLFAALVSTVTGIARGLQNTG